MCVLAGVADGGRRTSAAALVEEAGECGRRLSFKRLRTNDVSGESQRNDLAAINVIDSSPLLGARSLAALLDHPTLVFAEDGSKRLPSLLSVDFCGRRCLGCVDLGIWRVC